MNIEYEQNTLTSRFICLEMPNYDLSFKIFFINKFVAPIKQFMVTLDML